MLRNIIKHPNPLLREKSKEVKDVFSVGDLIVEMTSTMYGCNGLGIAAPQIGVLQRIFVLDGKYLIEEDKPLVFINPKIVEFGEERESEREGCLSFPNQILITRPCFVRVQATDEKGDTFEVSTEGIFSRAIQHELDHLDGILMIDRVPSWRKRK